MVKIFEEDKRNKILSKYLTPTRAITLGFLVVIFLGGFLLCLPISNNNKEFLNFGDALFTAVSATCVTGLVVVDTAVQFNLFGQIIILLLIQVGGLGFMTITTLIFILMGKRITLKERLVIQESLSQFNLQGLVRMTKNIFKLTFMIEGIGAILLTIGFCFKFPFWKSLYYGIFHSISAFCNAGFDVVGKDFTPYSGLINFNDNWLILITLSFLIITGGLGFVVFGEFINKVKFKNLMLHSKIVIIVTSILLFSGTILFLLAEYNNKATIGNMNFLYKFLNSFFQSVTPRTAGYASINQADLTEGSKSFTMFLMFIGASPASTGGGIKTTTLFVLLLISYNNLRSRNEVLFNMQKISFNTICKTISMIVLGAFTVFATTMIMSFVEKGFTTKEIMFEAISAFATVGLTLGITPSLTLTSKILLMLSMFIGRVGPITLGIALTRKQINTTGIKYPDAKIIVC